MKLKDAGGLVALLFGGLLLLSLGGSVFDGSKNADDCPQASLSKLERLRLEIAEKEVAWQRRRVEELEAKLGGPVGVGAGKGAKSGPGVGAVAVAGAADTAAYVPQAGKASLRGAVQRNKADLEQQQVRANAVRGAMQHAWDGYEKCAMGKDEILPRTCRGNNRWQGLAVTLIDSLDTLYLMGLNAEFDRAVQYVQTKLQFPHKGIVSVFETSIRVVGGLLGAHALSKRPVLLQKAKEMADMLTPAFQISPSGLPLPLLNLASKKAGTQKWTTGVVLADFGSMALEFRYLSQQTGDPSYAALVDRVYERCAEMVARGQTQDGLVSLQQPLIARFSRLTNGSRNGSRNASLPLVPDVCGSCTRREVRRAECRSFCVSGVARVLLSCAAPRVTMHPVRYQY
jgi:hypothetical protein